MDEMPGAVRSDDVESTREKIPEESTAEIPIERLEDDDGDFRDEGGGDETEKEPWDIPSSLEEKHEMGSPPAQPAKVQCSLLAGLRGVIEKMEKKGGERREMEKEVEALKSELEAVKKQYLSLGELTEAMKLENSRLENRIKQVHDEYQTLSDRHEEVLLERDGLSMEIQEATEALEEINKGLE